MYLDNLVKFRIDHINYGFFTTRYMIPTNIFIVLN